VRARRRVLLAGAAGAAGFAARAWQNATRSDAEALAADPKTPILLGPDTGTPADVDVRTVESADGTLIAVRVTGPADAPTVVLAHGWTCTQEFWRLQVWALRDRLRLVTYDQRGHGASGTPAAEGFSPDALADDLNAVVEATVPAGERAVLVGHSMGAMSIVAWAGRYPDQVRRRAGAVLLASTGVSRLIDDSGLAPVGPPWLRAVIVRQMLGNPMPYGPPSPFTSRLIRYVSLSRGASPAEVAFCERIVLTGTKPRARVAWSVAMDKFDLTGGLTHLDVPTTVLVGTADRLTPPVHARRMVQALPQAAQLVELPEVGHMTPVEAPDTVTDLITDLVKIAEESRA
jgi:pimeloyl-ACP methyl ester carboxylesterase